MKINLYICSIYGLSETFSIIQTADYIYQNITTNNMIYVHISKIL